MATNKVAVALSGGVDSAVTAALLLAQGYDVSGVTLRLLAGSSVAVEHAQLIASHLNISHTILDLSAVFESTVIEPFCRAYSSGLTPNPCIICNRDIKFGYLLDWVRQTGVDLLATGHYARLGGTGSRLNLFKGVDSTKDQSYFLYRLRQEQMGSLLFPLGGYQKRDVYQLAHEMGLDSVVQPHESQDICFIPEGDYSDLAARYNGNSTGDIVDTTGKILGQHRGIFHYTVGQRQGLGISASRRLYVLEIDTARNRVIVGDREKLYASEISAHDLAWLAGEAPSELEGISVRVRSQAAEIPADIKISGGSARICLASPQWAVTPGQSAVFYRGQEVLGGGIIVSTRTEAS